MTPNEPIVSRRGLLALASALAGTGLLAGCTAVTGAGTAEADLLAAIKERGEMLFATEGTWSPWTFHAEDGGLTGYDIEVARAIAGRLGVEAAFAEGEWDGLFAGLDSKRYDAVANGVDVTEERAKKYDFTEPYAYNRTVIIARGDDDRIASFEDLAGKTTANTISSTYAQVAEEYGATAQGVDDLMQTIELLEAGRIDATLNAEVVFYDYLAQHPDANLKIAAVHEEATDVSIPVRKGAETASLLEAMNEAISGLREDGVLAELSTRFFGVDISREGAGAPAAA